MTFHLYQSTICFPICTHPPHLFAVVLSRNLRKSKAIGKWFNFLPTKLSVTIRTKTLKVTAMGTHL